MTEKEIQAWYDTCCMCKKQKPNMKKARCQIYHAVCVAKSPQALDNISLFTGPGGTCKEFQAKGDSDDEDAKHYIKSPKRQGPANW